MSGLGSSTITGAGVMGWQGMRGECQSMNCSLSGHCSCQQPTIYDVKLIVYDLSKGVCAECSTVVLGTFVPALYHCGIEVYGIEYWYGSNGIMAAPPGVFAAMNSLCPISVHNTTTRKHQCEFESFLRSKRCSYGGELYHLGKHNCNNFANACSSYLTNGNRIPSYILFQPTHIAMAPGARKLLPLMDQVTQMLRNGNDIGMSDMMGGGECGCGGGCGGGMSGMNHCGGCRGGGPMNTCIQKMMRAIKESMGKNGNNMPILDPFGDGSYGIGTGSCCAPQITMGMTYSCHQGCGSCGSSSCGGCGMGSVVMSSSSSSVVPSSSVPAATKPISNIELKPLGVIATQQV